MYSDFLVQKSNNQPNILNVDEIIPFIYFRVKRKITLNFYFDTSL